MYDFLSDINIKDVPLYTVVGNISAKEMRKHYNEEIIDKLQRIQ